MMQNGAVLLIFSVLICLRTGLAYELTHKAVLRGGFAIYSIPIYLDGVNQSGFSRSPLLVPTLNPGLTFIADLTNLFPGGVLDPPGASPSLATFLGQDVSFVPLERKNTLPA